MKKYSLFDIKRYKDQYFVYFESSINLRTITFILGCESTLVQTIINAKREIFDYGIGISKMSNQFGVIASISSIEKRRRDESDYFVAYGNCVDLLFLGPFSIGYFIEYSFRFE